MVNSTKSRAHTVYKLADGRKVPGVTTIVDILDKPALILWANRLGLQGIDSSKYRDDKADIGTLAHYMILCYLRGEKPNTSEYSASQIDQAENAFIKFLDWSKGKKLEPEFIEVPLVSELHGFGGTPDFAGLIDGVASLVDFKTGSGIYDEMPIKLAGYRQLLIDNLFIPAQCHILRIGRDDAEGFEHRPYNKLDLHWQVFEHCLEIYRLRKQMKGDRE